MRPPRLPKLTESQVTEAVIGHARAHGWRAIRLQTGLFTRPGSKARIRIGATGQPDWLLLRPQLYSDTGRFMTANVFFLELKRPGKEPSSEQTIWMEQARRDGYLCVWADSFEGYLRFYHKHFGDGVK